MGAAVPHQVGRHVHPAATTHTPTPAPMTGIDYLALVRDRHTTALATQRVNYAAMTSEPLTHEPAAEKVEAAVAADVASFAAYRDRSAAAAGDIPVLPGQTDLIELLATTTHDDDLQETQ